MGRGLTPPQWKDKALGPVTSISTCFRKYATFSGRADRSEFWWFGLIYLAGAFMVFWGIEWLMQGASIISAQAMLVYLALFLSPFLAVAWHRFHDMGFFGIPALLPFAILAIGVLISIVEAALVPSDWPGLIGALIAYGGFIIIGVPLLIWLLLPSQSGPNRYGPNPHEVPQ